MTKNNSRDSDIDVKYISELARLDIEDSLLDKYQKDMEEIVEYVNKLSELDLENISPTAHASKLENVLREDEVENNFTQDDMLYNAPDTLDEKYIKVPRVIQEDQEEE